MTLTRHAVIVLALVAAAAAALPRLASGGSEQRALTRSIYVPIRFSIDAKLAPALRVWVVAPDDEDTMLSVRPHTFMFTYFPESESASFQPERIEVRLQALGACDGPDLDTNFFVTPFGLFTSEEQLPFDVEKLTKQLRTRKRDLRVDPKTVRVRCPGNEEGEQRVAGGPRR